MHVYIEPIYLTGPTLQNYITPIPVRNIEKKRDKQTIEKRYKQSTGKRDMQTLENRNMQNIEKDKQITLWAISLNINRAQQNNIMKVAYDFNDFASG